jgi:hypothetical protein
MNQKIINISSVESTEKKINLLDDKLKYNFWRTKKDGTPTRAEKQFQKFRFLAGDTVEAMVEETPQTFVNEKGKEIKFTDRKIAYFITEIAGGYATPAQPIIDQPDAPQQRTGHSSEQAVAFKAFLAQMQESIKDLESRVAELEKWKEQQPVYTDVNGKYEIVPPCFDNDISID